MLLYVLDEELHIIMPSCIGALDLLAAVTFRWIFVFVIQYRWLNHPLLAFQCVLAVSYLGADLFYLGMALYARNAVRSDTARKTRNRQEDAGRL